MCCGLVSAHHEIAKSVWCDDFKVILNFKSGLLVVHASQCRAMYCWNSTRSKRGTFSSPVFERAARYQQVWNAGVFAASGVIEISPVSFEISLGSGATTSRVLRATYPLSFSARRKRSTDLISREQHLGLNTIRGATTCCSTK